MENEIKGLLKRLTEAPGVSGYEMDVGKIIYHELEGHVDSIETDNFGNVISLKKASVKDGPKIMLAGHMDEIGLLVKHIDEKGFLHFERIGGVFPLSLFSQPVTIHCKKGPVSGLTYCKPPETPEEANKMPEVRTFFIDIGVKSRAEAEKLGVRIGDSVTFERPFKVLGGRNILASKAFDDRVGVCVIVQTMKNIAKEKLEANVYGVADVQEEVGCRGAQIAAFKNRSQHGHSRRHNTCIGHSRHRRERPNHKAWRRSGNQSYGCRWGRFGFNLSSKGERASGFNRGGGENSVSNGSPPPGFY